jgi:hypothetical protein
VHANLEEMRARRGTHQGRPSPVEDARTGSSRNADGELYLLAVRLLWAVLGENLGSGTGFDRVLGGENVRLRPAVGNRRLVVSRLDMRLLGPGEDAIGS